MKKSLPLIAGLSMLALGVPTVSFAQAGAASGPFADVPADHWAYQSVDTLQKAGIVIGYPDGTYGGKRAMTRYEFAVAIARLMPLINNQPKDVATKDDLVALRADLEKKLQANSDAVDALRKLVDEFQPELQKLGQDVAAVKDRLDSLEARVAAVEAEQARVKFHGELNIISRSNNVSKGTTVFDNNGAAITANKHLLAQSDVYNDFVLDIAGKVSDTGKVNVILNFSNYIPSLFNIAENGMVAGGTDMRTPAGSLTAAHQGLNVPVACYAAPVDLGPIGPAQMVVGRFAQQYTKYTLQQTDPDVYTVLGPTDGGNVFGDGIMFNGNIGIAKVNAYAEKFSIIPAYQLLAGNIGSAVVTPSIDMDIRNRASIIDQGAGARATFNTTDKGVIGVTLEQFGLGSGAIDPESKSSKTYHVLSVYGLDYNGPLPIIKSGITLDTSLTIAPLATSSYNFNNTGQGWRYSEAEAIFGYQFSTVGLKAGYQFIGPDFSAPGNWGRLGSWLDPTNIKGAVVNADWKATGKLNITGDLNLYKSAYSASNVAGAVNSILQKDDKVNRYKVGCGYDLASDYNLNLSYENVSYDLKVKPGLVASGKPTQQFYTVGLNHTFNKNATFTLIYQVAQQRGKGTGFYADADGNFVIGQFTSKF